MSMVYASSNMCGLLLQLYVPFQGLSIILSNQGIDLCDHSPLTLSWPPWNQRSGSRDTCLQQALTSSSKCTTHMLDSEHCSFLSFSYILLLWTNNHWPLLRYLPPGCLYLSGPLYTRPVCILLLVLDPLLLGFWFCQFATYLWDNLVLLLFVIVSVLIILYCSRFCQCSRNSVTYATLQKTPVFFEWTSLVNCLKLCWLVIRGTAKIQAGICQW